MIARVPRPSEEGLLKAIGGVLVALAVVAAGLALRPAPQAGGAGVEVVAPAPFEVAITGVGDLVPRKRHMIASTFSGKVEELAPEGQEVKAGAVVARLATQDIEERMQEDQLELETVRKDLEVRAATARRDREKQRTEVAAARDDLALQRLLRRQLEAGTPKAEVKDLVLRAEGAAKALAHAEEVHAAQVALVDQGIIRPIDLKGAKVDLAAARKADAVATTALRIARAGYADYAVDAQRLEAEKAANKHRLAVRKLAHLERVAAMQRAVDGARLKFLESRVAEQKHRLADATLKAPAAGVVVLQSVWTNSGRKKLQVGDEARESAAFMEIADVSSIYVKGHVPEADFGRVHLGMPARITVASLNKGFPGKLTGLGVLAFEKPGLINAEGAPKVFEATIETAERSAAFRPGMTVDVALLVKTVPGALSVPNRAIFQAEGRPAVRARRPGGRWEVRPIEVAEHTAERTRVTGGLAAGDEVMIEEAR